MKKITAVFMILSMAGCAGVTYTEDALIKELRYTQETANNYTADNEWWKAYNDTELNRLVDMALENNVDYGQSVINVSIALYQANLAGLDIYPTLTGSTGASASRDLTSSDGFQKSFSGELSLSYEFDLFRKANLAADAQMLEYNATVLDRETAKLVLVNSIVDVYFNLMYLYGAAKATEANLENYRKLFNIAHAKYTYGKSDSSEYTQAQQSLIAAENSLLEINDQIRSAEQTLFNLLNLKPSDDPEVKYSDILDVVILGVNLDVPLAVIAERPDLKASELRLLKSFKNVQQQNRSWYPTISLRTAISSSSDSIGTMFDFPLWGNSLSISLPFLQWNTVRNNIKISEAEYESTLMGFEGNINTALNEVAYYYYAYRMSEDLLANSRSKYDTDLRLTSYHTVRYDNGKTELSELLNALNNENASRQSLLSSIYQLIKYENMVYKSMAGRYTLG